MNDTTANSQPATDDSPPEIPDFELMREIGRGGFGRVWLARNRTTSRLWAVKVIPKVPKGTQDPAGREIVSITRLEANVRCRHANLLAIHHVGQTTRHLFYVMDLADDLADAAALDPASYRPATLERRLADGPLPAEDCILAATQLLQALASLHQSGMIHRDVKPANCLFVDGQLRLADFGLLTQAGPQTSRIGTTTYMPPDGRMDARADVYAAGLVVYEMITGLPADRFPQLGGRADPVAADPRLSALLRLGLDACQPDPRDRFPDGGQMLAALDRSLHPTSHAGGRQLRRRAAVALTGTTLVGALALGTYWWIRPPRVHVNFVTYPFEATILLDGSLMLDPEGDPLKTPCTVEDLPARTHQVVFQHPERPDLDSGPVDFGVTRQIVGRWDSHEDVQTSATK